jgi:GNAT superfamily N-acetyltransferase
MLISYLHDQPQFIDKLAPLLLEQWRHILDGETIEYFHAKLKGHLNLNTLPIAWVAHSGEDLLGTASLRVHDLDGREVLTPWLGGVFVTPARRREGIGVALCQVVEAKAFHLGYPTLHLFTFDKQLWYTKQGWQLSDTCAWRGHPGNVMLRSLASR